MAIWLKSDQQVICGAGNFWDMSLKWGSVPFFVPSFFILAGMSDTWQEQPSWTMMWQPHAEDGGATTGKEPGSLTSWSAVSAQDWQPLQFCDWECQPYLSYSLFTLTYSQTGEGNGNPLQCSCLENPRDRRALWAAVYGVTQSRTWLKLLSSSSSRCSVNYPIIVFMGVVQGMESKRRTWADSVTVLL